MYLDAGDTEASERCLAYAEEVERLVDEANAAWDSAEHNAKRARKAEDEIDFLRRCTRGFVLIDDHGEMETWQCVDCHGREWVEVKEVGDE
jgi:hypothetical protein